MSLSNKMKNRYKDEIIENLIDLRSFKRIYFVKLSSKEIRSYKFMNLSNLLQLYL
jgi:hypothetical protein